MTAFFRKTLRKFLPPLMRVKFDLRCLEGMCNHNEKFDTFDPRLNLDMDVMELLSEKGREHYHSETQRLRNRVDLLCNGEDVSRIARAKPGWLSFELSILAMRRERAYKF